MIYSWLMWLIFINFLFKKILFPIFSLFGLIWCAKYSLKIKNKTIGTKWIHFQQIRDPICNFAGYKYEKESRLTRHLSPTPSIQLAKKKARTRFFFFSKNGNILFLSKIYLFPFFLLFFHDVMMWSAKIEFTAVLDVFWVFFEDNGFVSVLLYC